MTFGLEAVTVRYGRRIALEGVSLPVAPGRVSAVVGGDGAGKSTALAAMVGLVVPASGLVRRPAKSEIGYVPATAGHYGDLTVEENLRFTAEAFRIAPAERDARMVQLLEQTGLDTARHRLGAQLSGGMQRKLAVVMALLHRPKLLVLDEPTSGVGPLAGARLWEQIRADAERGAGVLVTTHNLEEAEQCDRLVVMVDGSVAAMGTAAEIIGERTVTEVRTEQWERALSLLEHDGFAVQLHGASLRVNGAPGAVAAILSTEDIPADVTSGAANLEEAFVAIVTSGAAPVRDASADRDVR